MTSFKRAIVYVDGLNLYGSALRSTKFKWLDIWSMSQTLTPAGYSLEAAKYFSAELSSVAADDPDAPKRQRNYMKALAATRVDVRRGVFIVPTGWRALDMQTPWEDRTRPQLPQQTAAVLDGLEAGSARAWKARVQLPEEKFTDVALAVEVVDDFHNKCCELALIITNDSDFKPAIEKVVNQGHEVGVLSPADTNKKLKEAASWYRPLRENLFRSHQLPPIVKATDGSQFECPNVWK